MLFLVVHTPTTQLNPPIRKSDELGMFLFSNSEFTFCHSSIWRSFPKKKAQHDVHSSPMILVNSTLFCCGYPYWLVVWNMFIFPFSWEFHNPN